MINSETIVNNACRDEVMADETSRVDWHQITEQEGVTFGIAVSLYNDVVQTYEKRRTAWATATGGVISMSVLAIFCALCHTNPWITVGVIVGTQALRTLWLYRNVYLAAQDTKMMERQAIEVVRELAALHPVQK